MELTGVGLQQACDYVLLNRNRNTPGEMGVVSVSTTGEIGITFNCERMHRAWIGTDGEMGVAIYK